jgi:hypothetical protein
VITALCIIGWYLSGVTIFLSGCAFKFDKLTAGDLVVCWVFGIVGPIALIPFAFIAANKLDKKVLWRRKT